MIRAQGSQSLESPITEQRTQDDLYIKSESEIWCTVKPKIRRVKSDINIFELPITNSFASLVIDDSTMEAVNYVSDDINSDTLCHDKVKSPVKKQSNRGRPEVVVDHIPDHDRNLRQQSRIVPEFQRYSKAHIRDTLIVTDSMTSRIRAKDLKQNINLNEENVIM